MANQLGICEWVMRERGPTAIAYAGQVGFDGIQLGDAGGSQEGFPLCDPTVQKSYLDAATRAGITMQSLHLYTLVRQGGTEMPRESRENQQALHSIQKGLEACVGLQIPILQLTSYDACAINNEEEAINTAITMRKACRMGREAGIALAWECVGHIDTILYVLEVAAPDLKMCFDLGNPIKFATGDPVKDMLEIGVDRIDHVHIKDMPLDADQIRGSWPIGQGCARLEDAIDTLKQQGFPGWIITENFYENSPLCQQGAYDTLVKNDLHAMKMLLSNS